LADGATVDRADYPRLVRLADKHNLWTNDTVANAGLFGVGDGSTTMVLPNWIDRTMQMASTAGASVAAGLPNITGTFDTPLVPFHNNGWQADANSAVYIPFTSATTNRWTSGANASYARGISFDASRSNPIYGASTTVQPPAIKLLPILRY
jgi:hypothetical protein